MADNDTYRELGRAYESVVLVDGQRVAAFWLPEDRRQWADAYAGELEQARVVE